ncbi:MAG: hypothetical protein HC935_10870 [Pseudanabaena sp. SU_2_4]|nr:hypothetical protein [Pseudanabaena sp. SU_2_4]
MKMKKSSSNKVEKDKEEDEGGNGKEEEEDVSQNPQTLDINKFNAVKSQHPHFNLPWYWTKELSGIPYSDNKKFA